VDAATTASPFLVESVSMNVMIHKIHMGAELSAPYALGANRTAADATPGAEGLADFSQFESPSPVANCQTCHAGETFVLPETPNLLPIKRTPFTCGTPGTDTATDNETTTDEDGVTTTWCGNRVAGAPRYFPPQQGVCMGCHDTDAAKAHFDLNTIYPTGQTAATYNPYPAPLPPLLPPPLITPNRPPLPTQPGSIQPIPANTAIEACSTCHGAGRDFDVVSMHPPVLEPTADLDDTP
jgi:OmcA/MtrC family decaheme c-type cytochrome